MYATTDMEKITNVSVISRAEVVDSVKAGNRFAGLLKKHLQEVDLAERLHFFMNRRGRRQLRLGLIYRVPTGGFLADAACGFAGG
jgi:hypothetical protein